MAENQRIPLRYILKKGLEILGCGEPRQQRLSEATRIDLFRSNFGVGPGAVAAVYRDLAITDVPEAYIHQPNVFYLLLAFYWLKAYQTEDQMYVRFGGDKETMRNQIKLYVEVVAALKEIKIPLPDFTEFDETFILSVDGVHFRINEPRKEPSASWCSHKNKSAGLGYEIGVFIWHNQVAWIEGPFQPAIHDKTKYQEKDGLQSKIPEGKLVVGDRGYRGEDIDGVRQKRSLSTRNTRDTEELKAFKRRARARHENFNARLKNFAILDNRFRHGVARHKAVFEAVCVLCQYDMENGYPLFDV